MFWMIAWTPLTSLCLWGAYRLQKSQPAESKDGSQ
jgi:hypothetical protein